MDMSSRHANAIDMYRLICNGNADAIHIQQLFRFESTLHVHCIFYYSSSGRAELAGGLHETLAKRKFCLLASVICSSSW